MFDRLAIARREMFELAHRICELGFAHPDAGRFS